MPITRTEIDNGFMLDYRNLTVEITNDARFFTIYENAMPVGTITRPLVMGGTRKWQVHRTDGTLIAEGVGPRYCFARFINCWYR